MENKKMNLEQFTELVREINYLSSNERWSFVRAFEELDSKECFDTTISENIAKGTYLYAYLDKYEYNRMRFVRKFAAYDWECDEITGYKYIVLWRIN